MAVLSRGAKHLTVALVETSCSSLREIKQVHAHLLASGVLKEPFFLGQFVALIALNHPSCLDYSTLVLDQCSSPTLFAFNSIIRAFSRSSAPHKCFQFYNEILRSPSLSPDNYTFTFLVRASIHVQAGWVGPATHGSVLKYGFGHDPHVHSGLVFMYGELGCLASAHDVFVEIPEPDFVSQTSMLCAYARLGHLDSARLLFDKMPKRDHVAWGAMISGYVQGGKAGEALDLFHLMQLEGLRANEGVLVSVLSACAYLGAFDQGRWAHLYIKRNGISMTVTVGTALIDMYAKCGDLDEAMQVFWGMKERNVYTWSSAMCGLAMNGAGKKCFELFQLMKQEGVWPNEVTFLSLLQGCATAGLEREGQEIFDSMKTYGLKPRTEHYGCLVDLYGRAGRLDKALGVINNMPMKPHDAAWGALLNACRIHGNKELGELASRKIIELQSENHCPYIALSNIYAEMKVWDGVAASRSAMRARDLEKIPGCSVVEVDREAYEFFAGKIRYTC